MGVASLRRDASCGASQNIESCDEEKRQQGCRTLKGPKVALQQGTMYRAPTEPD